MNCDGPKKYNCQIVKMIHGDTNPRGPGLIEENIDANCNGEHKGRPQTIYSGSYGYVVDNKHLQVESFTMQCWIWPTTPKTHPKYWRHGAQGLMTKWSNNKGYGLFINEDGCLELRINGTSITTGAPIRDHAWHFVAASFDASTGQATLYHEPQIVYALDPEIPSASKKVSGKIEHTAGVPFAVAAYAGGADSNAQAQASRPAGMVMAGHYNGKIDSPRLCRRALSREEI